MRVPSGDQIAPEPLPSWRLRVPSAFISHRSDSRASSSALIQVRV